MTSYEYTIYELHYYVEYTHKDNDGSIDINTGEERVRIFNTIDELMDMLEELKQRYDGHERPTGYGKISKKLSKSTYIEVRTTKRTFAVA